MTDGTYTGVTDVAPIPDTYARSQRAALDLWPAITEWVNRIPSIARVFWVGAGGSYVGLTAAQYTLDTRGVTPSTMINPAELVFRALPSLDENSLVIVLSGAGNTPETARAADWARERGAHVAAVTSGEDSAVARAAQTAFITETGEGNQLALQLVALAVLAREGASVDDEQNALRALPDLIDGAVEAFEPRAREIAAAMKDVPVTYLMASGPLVGPGNTFTSCFLQEMQWMHAATVNSNDFFQGPFEVFDKETRSFLFLGEDATRPMGERVLAFLEQYSGPTEVIDGRDLVLPGLTEPQRAFAAPLVFYTLMFRLAAHYAAVRGYALEGRRYMWQFEY